MCRRERILGKGGQYCRDQHLDRLGSILRSLRARPSDRVFSSSAAQLNEQARRHENNHVHQPEPLHQHHTNRREKQPQRHQQPQPQQQHHQHEHERFLYVPGSSQSSQSRPSRSRTASQSWQPEVTITTTTTPALHSHRCSGTTSTADRLADKPESDARKQDAPLRRPRQADMGAVRRSVAPPTPQFHERVGGADDKGPRLGNDKGPHLGDPDGDFVPWAPSSTVVVRPGVVGAEAGSCGDGGGTGTAASAVAETTKRVRGPSLRERAIRTWWRGLSCGICFAAGAWAREGHGTFGALLALAAVCGEMVFHEHAPS
ncbi:unnamed protein product [Ectocarpus sp. CCAP 1310/34]|nr:unnamed protein product [Ectocarpus sp. CCAP 1310/34]